MKLLSNKVALITGASKGIGKSIALKFAEEGAKIAFTFLSNKDKALLLEEELKNLGVVSKSYQCDASSFEDSEQLVKDVIKDFGNLDILVNNAGITKDGLFLRMSLEAWTKVINNNLTSVFNTTKSAVATFMKQKSGSIINMSSIVGLKGNAGQANYAASKSGIIGLTKSLALELGPRGIRVNAIAPGFIETDMTGKLSDSMKEEWTKMIPLRRSGKTEDVANCAVFLASEMSSYISGQVLQVDGGLLT